MLTVSALTGARVDRILPLVDEVHEQATRRLSTGRLNNWLKAAVGSHRPPSVAGRDLFSYHRYLENSLREHFGLSRTPVRLEYRERPRRAKLSEIPPRRSRRRPV